MPDLLIILITVVSIVLAAWTYWRAFKTHKLIEARHPGFNALMRRCKRWS